MRLQKCWRFRSRLTHYCLTGTFLPAVPKFWFNLRRDHQKNFLWVSWLWVGRRKEPILGYVPKNYERRNSGSNRLNHFAVWRDIFMGHFWQLFGWKDKFWVVISTNFMHFGYRLFFFIQDTSQFFYVQHFF